MDPFGHMRLPAEPDEEPAIFDVDLALEAAGPGGLATDPNTGADYGA